MVSVSLFLMQTLSFMDKLKDIFNHFKVAGPWFVFIAKIGKHVETLWDLIKAICALLKV